MVAPLWGGANFLLWHCLFTKWAAVCRWFLLLPINLGLMLLWLPTLRGITVAHPTVFRGFPLRSLCDTSLLRLLLDEGREAWYRDVRLKCHRS